MMMNDVLTGIMGLCVADALGVPVEFKDRNTLKKSPVVNMQGYGTYNQPMGTWSDDTSMTLCLVDSLAEGLNYRDIMSKFLSWYQRGDYTPYGEAFDIGGTTREALNRFAKDTNPLDCGGAGEHDNGNGSLMRILPVVFYLRAVYGDNFYKSDEAFDIIHNISSLTHAHNRSKIACGIYICVASCIMDENELNGALKMGILYALEYYRSHGFTEELSHFKRLENEEFAQTPESMIKSSGYVVDTLEAAIWCLLNTESYKDCVLKAVNLGEDTDTVAAVAGGLAGLYYKSIPEEWLSVIAKRDYVEGLCNKLHKSLYRLGIEKLCAYIPYFETATADSVTKWDSGGGDSDNKTYTLTYPDYDKTLLKFIDDFYKSKLLDQGYLGFIEERGLKGPEQLIGAIDNADFELLRAILTMYVRQERFIDGLWAGAVEDKVFLKILKRLQELQT